MKVAVGVHYLGDGALAAGVAFDEWDAPEASRTSTSRVAHVYKPERGKPDLCELPCLVQLLRDHALEPDFPVLAHARLRGGDRRSYERGAQHGTPTPAPTSQCRFVA